MNGPRAEEYFRGKAVLPTELRTREFARLPLWIKEQSFFMAGVMEAELAGAFQRAAQAVLDGKMGEAEATRIIREGLEKSGYKPQPGQEGTIKDLTSVHRQLINLRTNVALANGWAADATRRKESDLYPALALVRGRNANEPRLWQQKLWPEAVAASGSKAKPDQMAALIDDPVWLALSDFGVPYTPLKWGSGMRQVSLIKSKAREMGLLPPKGQPQPPPAKPPESLNSTMEVTADQIPQDRRNEMLEKLDGLAVFQKDKLVFTDPNGSRPWPVPVLADLLPRQNVDGTENYQKRALREWRNLGGDAAAMAAMEKEFAGTDLLDDWNMLVRRVTAGERAQTAVAVVDALANLVSLVL
jgi:hypothetical protein